MTDFQTRKERHEEAIRAFLNTNEDATELRLRLYGREIASLSKKFPEAAILKGSLYDVERKIYNCIINRK